MSKSTSITAQGIARGTSPFTQARVRRLYTQRIEDETLVLDVRAGLRPSQMVEIKLATLLKSALLPLSHLLTRALCNGRGRR
jgi:hypothetical protein